ncbi:hypothetical protein EXIGLDRAFT_698476 [Exidia glandulosa HHB12029]|uniref:Uncharacterized protein n=1 Tax=Exidia glandulosa HHB12029 TaxID=1314781 RepID=A0A165E9K8_EXIGL|nr:hypothetical protein EXIGLDRAFT_698476 [Exidia glandulosa HHB12029]
MYAGCPPSISVQKGNVGELHERRRANGMTHLDDELDVFELDDHLRIKRGCQITDLRDERDVERIVWRDGIACRAHENDAKRLNDEEDLEDVAVVVVDVVYMSHTSSASGRGTRGGGCAGARDQEKGGRGTCSNSPSLYHTLRARSVLLLRHRSTGLMGPVNGIYKWYGGSTGKG